MKWRLWPAKSALKLAIPMTSKGAGAGGDAPGAGGGRQTGLTGTLTWKKSKSAGAKPAARRFRLLPVRRDCAVCEEPFISGLFLQFGF